MNYTQKGFTLWFTGLPCSGKTSLSAVVEKKLRAMGCRVEHLDGDVIRQNLSSDLGFSKKDRDMNIARTAFVASLLTKNGAATLVSFVSPYRQTRDNARKQIRTFIEVYVRCPLVVCEKRDVKGMYKLARKGEVKHFTGVSDPYEEPLNPEIIVDTDRMTIQQCAEKILDYLDRKKLLLPDNPFPQSKMLTKVFKLAAYHHRGQERKGGAPYIVHPISVAKMLKNAGCVKEIIAAGFLHDVLEDTGCEVEQIEREIGKVVARIVCEITDKDKTAPWRMRKKNYLAGLRKASRAALCVSCADKADNVDSLLEGYRSSGKDFFKSFSGKIRPKYLNYKNIHDLIKRRYPSCPVLPVFQAKLEEMKSLFVY